MSRRSILTIVLELVLSVLLALLLAGAYQWLLIGSAPADAFLVEAVRLVISFMDIGIVTWLILLVVGAVRRRGIGWGVGGAIVAALIGVVVNLVWVFILSLINGGADIFAIALGVLGGLFFLIAVVIVVPLVHRVVKPGAAASSTP